MGPLLRDTWDEPLGGQGQIISRREPPGVGKYPEFPHYRGTGSEDDAANFECRQDTAFK
jgi:hypothetical protein